MLEVPACGAPLKIRITGMTTVETVTDAGRRWTPLAGVKPRQVLGVLALREGEPVSKDALAEQLWQGRPPRSYLATLESHVCVLRRQLGVASGRRAALATTSRGYLLDPELVDVDAWEFRRLAEAALDAPPTAALALARTALGLVRGPLLAGETDAAWAEEGRRQFDRLLVRTCVGAASSALALGEHEAAADLAGRALDVDRLAEPAWLARMRAYAAGGRRLDALRCYAEMRAVLVEELGVDPGPEAQAMHLQLLRSSTADAGTAGEHGSAEVAVLLTLLRRALEAVPGLTVPAQDHGLSAVAARFIAAA